MGLINEITEFINSLHAEIHNKEYKILAHLPTKTGMHLEAFSDKYPQISCHKNNPCNAFIP